MARRTALALVGVMALTGCAPSPKPDFVTTGPIVEKNHYDPKVDPSFSADRWEFCFGRQAQSACVPVSHVDYDSFNVGDTVHVEQVTGELAEVSKP
jgi:hypothetical protein